MKILQLIFDTMVVTSFNHCIIINVYVLFSLRTCFTIETARLKILEKQFTSISCTIASCDNYYKIVNIIITDRFR